MIRETLRRSLSASRRTAAGGSALFLVVSLLCVAIAGLSASQGRGASYGLLGPIDPADPASAAPGLVYRGGGGALLAILQVAALLGAVAMTRAVGRGPRVLGHAVLVAWAGTWFVGLARAADLDPSDQAAGSALAMTAFLALTIFRGIDGVFARRSTAKIPADLDANDDSDDVVAPDAIDHDVDAALIGAAPVTAAASPERGLHHRLPAAWCGTCRTIRRVAAPSAIRGALARLRDRLRGSPIPARCGRMIVRGERRCRRGVVGAGRAALDRIAPAETRTGAA